MKRLCFHLLLAGLITSAFPKTYAQSLHWKPFGRIHDAQESGLAVTPNGTIFLAVQPYYSSVNGALFYSTDHGNTWHLKYTLSVGQAMYSLTALNDSVLLASIGLPTNWNGPSTSGYGLARSSDSGKTWKVMGRGGSIVSFDDVSAVVLGDSLYRTTDLGLSWHKIPLPPTSVSNQYAWHIKGLPGNGLVFFAAYYNIMYDSSIYITQDYATWRKVRLPHPPITDLLISTSGTLFAIGGPIYVSSDLGNSWVEHDSLKGRPVAIFKNGTIGVGAYTGPTNNPPLFAITRDSFRSWQGIQFDDYNPSSSTNALFSLDSSDNILLADESGIWRITDTSDWGIDCAPDHNPIPSLDATSNGTIMSAYGFHDITRDNGLHWQPLVPGGNAGVVTDWCGYNPRDGFIAETGAYYSEKYLLHSKDGFHWDTTGPLSVSTRSLLGFDRAGGIFAGKDSDVVITTDLGLTWRRPAISPAVQGTPGIVGLPDGSCISAAKSGIYHSTDVGLTWNFIPSSEISQPVRCVACDSNGNIIVLMDSIGAYLSTDLGTHWAAVNAGLDSIPNQILYSSEGFWLAATGAGVFKMRDSSSTWIPAMDGLDGMGVLSIAMARPGFYFAGTTLAGIYSTDTARATLTVVENQLSGLRLSAFPNPSLQSVRIDFQSPHTGYVEIGLFNPLGESIEDIYNQEVTSGNHEITFEHKSLPPGLYYLRAIFGGSSTTIALDFQQ